MRIIKNILLCPPDYFQVNYQINPWMTSMANQKQAQQQWSNLVKIYQRLNLEVSALVPQPQLPDMVFAADQGLVKDKTVILANFRFPQRRPEAKLYQKWFIEAGFKTFSLPNKVYFEGGDALDLGSKILLGFGFRTNPLAISVISRTLNQPVIGLRLVDDHFYHLDTCLFPLDSKTAFYYPPAFDPDSQKLLQATFPRLIVLSHKEAFGWAANSLNTDHQVITQKGNFTFIKQLKQLGFRVHTADVSEFSKAGGGIHCLGITTAWAD